jgi:hypothetical protein
MSAAALGAVSLQVGLRLATCTFPAATLTMEPVRTALCITYERRLGEADVHVEVSQPQMQDCTAGPVHDVCQQDDDQDHDHQPEEEHDDSGDDVPSYSSRSSHGLELPGAARIIRNEQAVPGCSRGAGVTAGAARRAAARTVPGVVCPYPHLAGVVCPSPRYPAGMTAATITFCAP